MIVAFSFEGARILLAVSCCALQSSVDDHDCSAKIMTKSSFLIVIVGLVESGGNLMHAGFRRLRCHVEPKCRRKRVLATRLNQARIFQQYVFVMAKI